MPETIYPDRVDIDSYDPGQSMVPDGFALDAYMRGMLPKRYRPNAIAALEWLRQSREIFFPRWYPTPIDSQTSIAAYDTFTFQHRVVPGAFIWGWNCVALTGTITNMYVLIVDHCTRQSIFQSYVNANMLRNTNAYNRPSLLPEPYKVESQGLIDVQIRNNSASAISLQFVLHVAEPTSAQAGQVQQGQSTAHLSGMPVSVIGNRR